MLLTIYGTIVCWCVVKKLLTRSYSPDHLFLRWSAPVGACTMHTFLGNYLTYVPSIYLISPWVSR